MLERILCILYLIACTKPVQNVFSGCAGTGIVGFERSLAVPGYTGKCKSFVRIEKGPCHVAG